MNTKDVKKSVYETPEVSVFNLVVETPILGNTVIGPGPEYPDQHCEQGGDFESDIPKTIPFTT